MKKFLFIVFLAIPIIAYTMQEEQQETPEPKIIFDRLMLESGPYEEITYCYDPNQEVYTGFFSSSKNLVCAKRYQENDSHTSTILIYGEKEPSPDAIYKPKERFEELKSIFEAGCEERLRKWLKN